MFKCFLSPSDPSLNYRLALEMPYVVNYNISKPPFPHPLYTVQIQRRVCNKKNA